MIIDTLNNSEKYHALHPMFHTAFSFLKSGKLAALGEEAIEIEDGLKAIPMEQMGKSQSEAMKTFECHRQNIDIQVCIDGEENFAWKSLENCKSPQADYDTDRDVQFFYDEPDMVFTLKAGQFVILFPEDVHAPMIAEAMVKKVVVKVRI